MQGTEIYLQINMCVQYMNVLKIHKDKQERFDEMICGENRGCYD